MVIGDHCRSGWFIISSTHMNSDETRREQRVDTSLTDAWLLAKVRDADEDAFRALFERYQPIVFRHVLFTLRDTELSHDIVQETFVRIWQKRQSLKPEKSFLAYALTIGCNLARDALRYRQTRVRLESQVPQPSPSEGDEPDEALQVAMLREEILAILNNHVAEKCRVVFVMSRYEGKSNREIADLLGVRVKTVEKQIGQVLKVLRRRLKT
jgi:RNA polymerase sigma-70 factor (family 1)